MNELAVGTRIGDYIVTSICPRAGDARATHVLLPRYATIAMGERVFDLACVLESIKHPTVPRVYECGWEPQPWVAFATPDGVTLSQAIASRPLPVGDAIRLIADLAGILAHAHRNRVVHGELGADRIVRTPAGWLIADWSGASQATDVATDIHALGVIAYGTLARSLPALPLAKRCPEVPASLARLIDRMIGEAPPAAVVSAEIKRISTLAEVVEADAEPIALEDIILLESEPAIPLVTRGSRRSA